MSIKELVTEQALLLSPEDRIDLLDRFEQSLIPDGMCDTSENVDGDALAAELKRRFDAYQSGATTACDAFELLTAIREGLADVKAGRVKPVHKALTALARKYGIPTADQ